MRGAAIAALALAGCLEVPPASCPPGGDADEDGWTCSGVGGDCDDGDPDRAPGRFDVCGDGIDQDCTGADASCDAQLPRVTLTDPDADTWQITTESTQVQLTAPGYLLSSIRLREDGEQLLYTGPDPEQLLALAIYPVFHRQDATATATVRADGPARVEVEVTWDDEETAFASGSTTFGFTPDGRIARRERVDANAYTHGASTLYFATFASFDSTAFSHVDWTANVAAPREVTSLNTGPVYVGAVTHLGWVCLSDEGTGRRIAMTWQPIAGAAGARVTRGPLSPPHLAFEYDWARAVATIAAGEYESVTMFAPSMLPTPAAEPCDGLDPAAITGPAPLLFVTGAAGDGDPDGDGFVQDDGVYEIVHGSGDDHVEVEVGDGPLDGGVTIRVLIEAPSGITVWRDGTRMIDGVDVLMQPLADNDGWLAYFPPGALTRDRVLRFALPGGEPA